ncbi:hypothetical protein Tco_0981569 [Tanacetum coccineum]
MDAKCLLEEKIGKKEILKETMGAQRVLGVEKENDEDVLSIEDILSTDKEKVSTDKEKVSTDRPIVSTDRSKVSTDWQKDSIDEQSKGTDDHTEEGSATQTTQTPTSTIFGDDETIDNGYFNMSLGQKQFQERRRKVQGFKKKKEKFTIEERAKLLHDTIAAQRRFLAQQRAAEIRSRPPTRTQLRNQMMTYLKHVGGKKHSDLKNKNFEEIQILIIRELNKKVVGTKKADSIKEESKEEAAPDEDKEVDYEILDRKYPIIEWKTEYLGIKPQFDETKGLEESNLNVVIRSNGQRRYFSTLMRVLSIFDREDLNVVYKLVMDRYQNEVPEGFDRVLWGDLMIMFNPNDEDEFWNTQQDWNVVSWKLHRSSGVHTLMTDTGLVIHMLVEKKYPLKRKVLLQMLELKLESEEDSTMALELIRFVKKLIAELEPEDSDGNEEDL